jgi:bifunctional oligoribonuclease and PAP phosphatase NrnA
VRTGVRPAKTAEAIFGSYQWPKIELLSHVLSTAKRDDTGHVAWMWQTMAMQEQTHAADEDADGFVNYPLAVGEVEATALFKETAPGVYRTSLRSKGDVNVAKIAEQFGGGGHRNAAGCTLKGTSSELEQKVVPLLQDAVKRSNGMSDLTEDALK